MNAMKEANLTNCDREPIHIPGSIQPHGAMFVLDASTHSIMYASKNCADYIGLPPDQAIGRDLAAVIGHEPAHRIGNVAARSGSSQADGVLINIPIAENGIMVDVTVHKFQERLILEFEKPASKADAEIALSLTQALVRRLGRVSEVGDLVSSVARLLRATLGYDRVMVYQFLATVTARW